MCYWEAVKSEIMYQLEYGLLLYKHVLTSGKPAFTEKNRDLSSNALTI